MLYTIYPQECNLGEMRDKPQRAAFTYFIQSGSGAIKIGSSNIPADRMTSMQVGHHEELKLLFVVDGTLAPEKELHRQFEAHRIRGEWFHPHQDIFDEIEVLKERAKTWKAPLTRPLQRVRLCAAMMLKGLDPLHLARKSRVPSHRIRGYLEGECKIHYADIRRLCKALGVSRDELED